MEKAAPLPAHPDRIGPYRILDVLGEGGMGSVYLAEQTEPVRRRVALKLIKLGMDSKAVVARFEQERQALALMQHDGIAKVLDCGTSDRGQPFFVMELVKGIPLTEFCNQNRVALEQRLHIMKQVCAAVTHAHQKGVVHRDLKPGNVLVADDGGKVQIKIIDFGLAKAMGQKLVEATLFTEAGQIIGTPEYMAPEQADPTNADIDTRADIYSLGVMLYEVLVGTLPFPAEDLRKAGMLRVQRILREVEPPRPSTRLSSIGDSSTAVAAERRVSVGALHRALKNDLDWVVLKAMEKDRNRRYDTANALAADLQRFLDHEPLVAGPPSAAYRLRKLLRRYRGQVLAGTAVLVTAVGGAIVAVNLTFAAQANEQRANNLAAEKGKALDDFRLLANVVQLDDAKKIEATLYPAFPDKAPAMKNWLRDFGEPLKARLPTLEAALTELRSKANAPTPEQRQASRASHPRLPELQQLQAQLASWERAASVRTGKALAELPALDAATQGKQATALNQQAWPLVDPDNPIYGGEPAALAMARLALLKVETGDTSIPRYTLLDTLAWACHRNGLDDEALLHSKAACDACPEGAKADYAGYTRKLEHSIAACRSDDRGQNLGRLREQVAALDAEISSPRAWEFADGGDRFLHETLSRLVADLRAFMGNKGEFTAVKTRLLEAESVRSRTVDAYRPQWDAAIAAIAAEPKYRGFQLTPQLGIVPLGPDPESKLWEFVHLGSGTPGKEIPDRDAETHRLMPTGDMGIVFVLLSGGTFTMGAQKEDKDGPNYDPQALPEETPHEVTLAPFFLSKYEMTQGQWARLWSGDERLRWPSDYKVGGTYRGIPVTIGASHPVETVSWEMCEQLVTRSGLSLPTEAQWEYGCRGNKSTPWYTGQLPTTLAGHANVLDRDAVRNYPEWGLPEAFEDGFAGPAPVGHYPGANGFGLFDVHGNVWEWCQDEDGSYSGAVREGDGLRLHGDGSSNRVIRGGGFFIPAAYARSAVRARNTPAIRYGSLGLRAARASRRDD